MQEQTSPGMEQAMEQDDFWAGEDMFDPETTDQQQPQRQEQAEPTEEAAQQQETQAPLESETPPEQPQQAQTVRVRYNGQDVDVPMDQAVTLIQKGMNYDHALAHVPERAFLNRLAGASGKTPEQYMAEVEGAMEQKQIRDLTAQGMTEQAAAQVLAARKEQQKAQAELSRLKDQISSQQAQISRQQMLREFFTRHADLNPKDVPREVLEAVSRGQDMESAYTAHQNKALQAQIDQLKAQLAAQESGKANAAKAVGSVAQSAPPREEVDEVWEAFMKG